MSKQLYYTERGLEQLTQAELEGWDGGSGIMPADFNDKLPFLGNPSVAYTPPAGVYATQLDIGQPEDDTQALKPSSTPLKLNPYIILGAIALYLLVRRLD